MRNLSDEAFAVMAVCGRTKKPFGMTVDKDGPRRYRLVWAFKVDKDKARREGYDQQTITGNVSVDPEFPGCPYCKCKDFFTCRCGAIVCYHGQEVVTCPECGYSGKLSYAEEVKLKGGGY